MRVLNSTSQNMRFRYDLLGLAVFYSVLFAPDAYGYLDAGTGSQVIQIVIAGSVGVIFALKIYFKKIKLFLVGRFLKKPKIETDSDANKQI